jgi:peptide/nickel transport system substrate-binding protein
MKKYVGLLIAVLLLLSLSLSAVQAQGGGTIVGAFDVGPGGAPLVRPFMDSAGRTWLSKIWSPLLSWNADATALEPQMATAWEPNEDATVWTITLRDGVTFHDGEPMTAEDVKFSLELAFNPEAATLYPSFSQLTAERFVGGAEYVAGDADEIAGIRIVDDLTLEFEFAEPNPRLPYSLIFAWVLPQHALADLPPAEYQTTDWFTTSAIGTGPFMHDEFVQDQFWALAPNPNYWRGAPKLDRLINRYFADETSALLALEGGEIQFTYAGADVALRMEGDSNFVLYSGPSGVTNYLIYNQRLPEFQDERVRQAIMYAIDRQAMAEAIMGGTVELVPCIAALPGLHPAADQLNAYAYDPEMARQLLAEAGWDSSKEYEMVTYYNNQQAIDTMAVIQQYLAEVGINVLPLVVDVPTYNSYFYTGEGWDISYRGVGATLIYPWQFYVEGGYDVVSGDTLMGPSFPELQAMMEAAQTETNGEAFTQQLQDICAYQNQTALEGYMWTATRFGIGADELTDFYWFPAQGGGPYEDHAELWSVSE